MPDTETRDEFSWMNHVWWPDETLLDANKEILEDFSRGMRASFGYAADGNTRDPDGVGVFLYGLEDETNHQQSLRKSILDHLDYDLGSDSGGRTIDDEAHEILIGYARHLESIAAEIRSMAASARRLTAEEVAQIEAKIAAWHLANPPTRERLSHD